MSKRRARGVDEDLRGRHGGCRLAGIVLIAAVTPISRIQPATSETTIDITMPRGPATAALWVSSVMCADAS